MRCGAAMWLIALSQCVVARPPCRRTAPEVPDTLREALLLQMPPLLHLVRVGPREIVVWIHRQPVIGGIASGTGRESVRRTSFQVGIREIHPRDHREALARHAGNTGDAHLLDEPGHRRGIAERADGCDEQPNVLVVLPEISQPRERRLSVHETWQEVERAPLKGALAPDVRWENANRQVTVADDCKCPGRPEAARGVARSECNPQRCAKVGPAKLPDEPQRARANR